MSEPVRIIERFRVPPGCTLLVGLPDVGLVGVIATTHIVSALGMEEAASVESELMPPIAVLHDGLPHSPIRIFHKDTVLAVLSETAIPAPVVQPLAKALVDWSKNRSVKMVISLGGLPTPERQELTLENIRIFGAASTPTALETLKNWDVEALKRGFMVGPYALILRYAAESGLDAIALLAQSFYEYPDPEAAAVVVSRVTEMLNLKVDVSELLKKGEEIRLRARDVMRRTQQELNRMKKSQEYDLPLYV